MKAFGEKDKNRMLRTVAVVAPMVVYWKLKDTLIADEWLSLFGDFVFWVVAFTLWKMFWYDFLRMDAVNRAAQIRIAKRQREQEAKTAASLEGGSKSGTATLSKNSPDNL